MIKKIKENIIFNNKFFTIYNDDVVFKNKNQGTHLKIQNNTTNGGIAVLPILKNGNVIIQEEYRYGIENYILQVVKGGIDIGQTKEQAVITELKEELNIKSDNLIFLGDFIEAPAILNHPVYSFLALNCEKTFSSSNTNESFKNKIEIPLDLLFKKVLNNEIKCAVTQMIILKANLLLNSF